MATTIRDKGSAAIISIFWNPSIPPEYITIAAIAERIIPQVILTLLEGFNFPPVVNIPSTNVAESAEVIKNIAITTIVINDNTVPSGYCSNIPKVTVSVSNRESCVIPKFSKFKADDPKTAKNSIVTNVGANNTPAINSLTVLPLDTRAMNIPTNGAQEIHQAQ